MTEQIYVVRQKLPETGRLEAGPAVWPKASFGGFLLFPSGFVTVLSLGEQHRKRERARAACEVADPAHLPRQIN